MAGLALILLLLATTTAVFIERVLTAEDPS
jgi:hypothetical protein